MPYAEKALGKTWVPPTDFWLAISLRGTALTLNLDAERVIYAYALVVVVLLLFCCCFVIAVVERWKALHRRRLW